MRGKAAIAVALIAGISVAFLLADLDGDGLNDMDEIYRYHTSPANPDSDLDGLTDGDEVLTYMTDPLERTPTRDELLSAGKNGHQTKKKRKIKKSKGS